MIDDAKRFQFCREHGFPINTTISSSSGWPVPPSWSLSFFHGGWIHLTGGDAVALIDKAIRILDIAVAPTESQAG